jgi:hypothetical protein
MRTKLLVFATLVVAVLILVLWPRHQVGRRPPVPSAGRSEVGATPPARTSTSVPLPSIQTVRLAVQGPDGGDLGTLATAPGDTAAVPGTDYRLVVTEFYTHWNWNKGPVNLSYEERNPAVRVDVLEADSLLYYQWAFRDMPFFRRGLMGGHRGTSNQLALSLLSYDGLTLPGSPAEGD